MPGMNLTPQPAPQSSYLDHVSQGLESVLPSEWTRRIVQNWGRSVIISGPVATPRGTAQVELTNTYNQTILFSPMGQPPAPAQSLGKITLDGKTVRVEGSQVQALIDEEVIETHPHTRDRRAVIGHHAESEADGQKK